MRVALICKDKPNKLQVRKDTRAAHLAYIEATGMVEMAGPLLDDSGEMAGSLIVLDAPDLETAQSWAKDDPYNKAGLFADIAVSEWNKVIG
ncbi:YciI family protein [Roseicyclus sp. F158]|uniref:YciI family protein n=1 Tax=Tropicimonas omnivorans TaxID=3075590 RepID=A0ABU3DD84_9RHOB|nr:MULTISPECIES: YciI family protein [Roseobacteraceae]MDT0681661.1 YciI family protein [Roseicyclus sp. F158]